MSTGFCRACQSETTFEYDPSSGGTSCGLCGAVAEESGIVSEITFGETSTGAAVVSGAYVGHDQIRAKTHGGRHPVGAAGLESREQTIANGRRKIQSTINALRLPDRFGDQAQRWYTLALNANFVRGRRTDYVVAACLYIVCRRETTSHMLIDFSDVLRVNVFVLGSTYLKLVKQLNLNIPAIDPSLLISRFASMLEFGEETQQVANDAIRLVQRFSRDWIFTGRRPAGICGAALILAARMNNFRRSIEEVVQVVKIADVTIKKRLEEFGETPTSQLTITDFRAVDLNEENDPPAFIEGVRKERLKREATEFSSRKKRKIRFASDSESSQEEEGSGADEQSRVSDESTPTRRRKAGKSSRSARRGLTDIAEEMEGLDQGDIPTGPEGLADTDDRFPVAEAGTVQPNADGDVDFSPDEQDEEDLLDSLATNEGALPAVPRKRGRPRKGASPVPDNRPKVDERTGQKLPPPDTRTAAEVAADEIESAQLANEIGEQLSSNKHFSVLEHELTEHQQARIKAAQEGRIPPRPVMVQDDPAQLGSTAGELDASLLDPTLASIDEVASAYDLAYSTYAAPPERHNNPDSQTSDKPPAVADADSNASEWANAARGNQIASTSAEPKYAPDLLDDLDEDELDEFILTEEEVRIKERLWMEFNKDYLANVAEKHMRAELDEKPFKKRERKKPQKPRDSTTARGGTAAEATKELLKQKKFSKKINYAAIEGLLGSGNDGDANGSTLFEETEGDDGRNVWETQSSRSSRASSVVSSLGRSRKPRKRSRSTAESEATDQAERLRSKIQGQAGAGDRRGAGKKGSASTIRPNSPMKKAARLPVGPTRGEAASEVGAVDENVETVEETVQEEVLDDEEDEAGAVLPDEEEGDLAEFRRLQRGVGGSDNEDEHGGGDDEY